MASAELDRAPFRARVFRGHHQEVVLQLKGGHATEKTVLRGPDQDPPEDYHDLADALETLAFSELEVSIYGSKAVRQFMDQLGQDMAAQLDSMPSEPCRNCGTREGNHAGGYCSECAPRSR